MRMSTRKTSNPTGYASISPASFELSLATQRFEVPRGIHVAWIELERPSKSLIRLIEFAPMNVCNPQTVLESRVGGRKLRRP